MSGQVVAICDHLAILRAARASQRRCEPDRLLRPEHACAEPAPGAEHVGERPLDVARLDADRADPELQHAIGRIAENDDRYLRVIYNAAVTPWRIVTAYFDRGLRSEE